MSETEKHLHLEPSASNVNLPAAPEQGVLVIVANPQGGLIMIFASVNPAPGILFISFVLLLSSCSLKSRQPYSDDYPQPCTAEWFVAIEEELKLVDAHTRRPPPGSVQWLNAADEKLSISQKSGYPVGDIEWCHQLHQALIGL